MTKYRPTLIVCELQPTLNSGLSADFFLQGNQEVTHTNCDSLEVGGDGGVLCLVKKNSKS